ncbi:FAD-binding domain-containing protein [Xylaria sp. FL1042]|nr:FAD-binding domain-containing protein [Xylaria sp. FL1042]
MVSSEVLGALQHALPTSQFALRGSDEYQSLNTTTYQSGLNAELQPAYIILPRTKQDVATFLSTIGPFVTNGKAKFAVVAGGRQPALGCSNIDNGITLNLSHLKGIVVQDGYVSISAGDSWGAVYDELGQRGLGCAGSRSAKGGIGGLPTQGGLSFFSCRDGFICDDVINYEVALASGDIVNANAEDNTDLWLALRGGGNNFGIITSIRMRTFKQGSFYGGSLYYLGSKFPGQVKALVNELQKPDASDKTHLMVSMGWTSAFGTDPICINQLYYNEAVENPSVLEPFTPLDAQIPGLNTLRIHTLPEAAKEQAGEITMPPRSAYMNTHIKADISMLLIGADIFKAAIEPIKSCDGLICSYTLQPYPVSLLKSSASKGGNSLGLDPSLGPIVSIALLMYWKSAHDDEKILGAFRAAIEQIDEKAKMNEVAIDFKFMNYSFNFQDPIGSYGPENRRRLQEASRKFDPEGVFQRGVPGGWKLFVTE